MIHEIFIVTLRHSHKNTFYVEEKHLISAKHCNPMHS